MKNMLFVVCCSALAFGCSPEESETEATGTQSGIGVKADQVCNTDTVESVMTGMSHDAGVEEGEEAFDSSSAQNEDSTADEDSSLLGTDVFQGDDSDQTDSMEDQSPGEEAPVELTEDNLTDNTTLCASADDPFAEAYLVEQHRVSFPEGTPAPTYQAASTDTSFYLGGTEFWQKWPGGKNPTYSYYEGTLFGQRCMYASARRFEAIMAVAPEALSNLRADSNWGGSFFNWNDDFSESTWGDGSSARLWAWRTTLVKWISQTNRDGSCYLPTLSMIQSLAEKCAARAASSEGEIQGCTN